MTAQDTVALEPVDREVVPRGDWAQPALHEGATVEVVMAIQGG